MPSISHGVEGTDVKSEVFSQLIVWEGGNGQTTVIGTVIPDIVGATAAVTLQVPCDTGGTLIGTDT